MIAGVPLSADFAGGLAAMVTARLVIERDVSARCAARAVLAGNEWSARLHAETFKVLDDELQRRSDDTDPDPDAWRPWSIPGHRRPKPGQP